MRRSARARHNRESHRPAIAGAGASAHVRFMLRHQHGLQSWIRATIFPTCATPNPDQTGADCGVGVRRGLMEEDEAKPSNIARSQTADASALDHIVPACDSRRHPTNGAPGTDTIERLGEGEVAGIRAQKRVTAAVVRLRGARSGRRQSNRLRDRASPKPAR